MLTASFFHETKRTATKFEGLEEKRMIRTVWVNSTGYLLQLCKIGIFQSIFLPSLHPSCFSCWTIPNHILKKYTI